MGKIAALRRRETGRANAAKRSFARSAPSFSGAIEYRRGRVSSGPTGPEVKNIDATVVAAVVSTAAPLVGSTLGLLAEGTGWGQRVGSKIRLIGCYVKVNMYVNTSVAGSGYGHWSLVLDKQPNGAVAAPSTVYTNSTSNLTQLNVPNKERFQVLATGSSSQCMYPGAFMGDTFEKYVKLDIGTRFIDATAEPNTNNLLMYCTSNCTAGNPMLIDWSVRVRFTDE